MVKVHAGMLQELRSSAHTISCQVAVLVFPSIFLVGWDQGRVAQPMTPLNAIRFLYDQVPELYKRRNFDGSQFEVEGFDSCVDSVKIALKADRQAT